MADSTHRDHSESGYDMVRHDHPDTTARARSGDETALQIASEKHRSGSIWGPVLQPARVAEANCAVCKNEPSNESFTNRWHDQGWFWDLAVLAHREALKSVF